MKWLLVTLLLGYLVVVPGVRAEECDNISGLNLEQIGPCISKFSGFADAISKANATNSQELANLNSQISKLKTQIDSLSAQIQKLTKDVFDREVKIGVRETLLAARVKRDYIRKKDQPIMLLLFSADNATNFFRDLGYREKLARDDRDLIKDVSDEITTLSAQKTALSSQKDNMDALKKRVDDQATFLAGEVAKANKYVSDLSGKIASLTARQNELLAAKTGTYQTSVGDVPLADDAAARPDYNPGFSPAFALFSFGAPHFKGMSQYGAFGRAKNGQNYKDILAAYYGNVEVRKVSVPSVIKTTVGTISFEGQYLKGIAEMPTVWADQGGYDALKAQAVAARSYALAYTGWRINNQNAGGTICTTEACQVYSGSKAGNPGRWGDAVRETDGEILVSRNSGEVVNAWYASTSGGYQESYTSLGHTTPGFWDTTSDWTRWADGAWEVKGGSPWFYKGWYKGRSGTACGRSHPWLHEDEFADIVNAALVYSNGGDASGIFPTDGCLGQTGWDKNKMANEADKYGGSVRSVNGVKVDHGSDGVTNKVTFSTNRGNVEISGANFYKVFNLRAPGAIHLTSGLFNVEKK